MQSQRALSDSALPSPAEVEALDNRRQWGLNFLVLAGQFATFTVLLWLWTGQDATYSPGWVHPMVYYDILCCGATLGCAGWGLYLRRGYQGL
jgi:hypothetical protein